MSLGTRTILVHAVQQAVKSAKFRFLPELAGDGEDLLLERYYETETDPVTGLGEIDLPVRSSGSITYRFEISAHNGMTTRGKVIVTPGMPISLGELILSNAPATDPLKGYVDSVVAEHAQLKATTTQLGHVKVDGTSITADGNGVISSAAAGGATGPAGGVLSGSYPNPGFAVDMAERSELNAHKMSSDHDGRYYTETEVDTLLAAKAALASPAFTGNPTAPTQASGNNSQRVATTAYVMDALAGVSLVAGTSQISGGAANTLLKSDASNKLNNATGLTQGSGYGLQSAAQSATDVPVIVQLAAAQSADGFQVRPYGSTTPLVRFDASGDLYLRDGARIYFTPSIGFVYNSLNGSLNLVGTGLAVAGNNPFVSFYNSGALAAVGKIEVISDGMFALRDSSNGLGKLVAGGGTPASSSASGVQGQVLWDGSYIYICTATNTWKRAAIASW